MIKIEFDNHTLHIPSCWDDIKLKDFEKWYLQTPETRLQEVQYVADICSIDAKELVQYPVPVFNAICNTIGFVFKRDYEKSNKVMIDKTEYFVRPSDKLTLGEWIDLETVLNGEGENKLSEILSIVCRPISEKYDPDVADGRKTVFMELPCSEALPCIDFFLSKGLESERILNLCSLQIEQATLCLKLSETFALDTAGIRQLPTWQRIRYIYLIQSLKKRLKKFSDSSYIEQIRLLQNRNNNNF